VDRVRQIADAVLYEGYILWPYRRSALKNQHRWTFGGVYPKTWSRARDGDDPWSMQTQCVLEGAADARLEVTVRFLHVVERQPMREVEDGVEAVDELRVGDDRYLAWQEATERELVLGDCALGRLGSGFRRQIEIEPGRTEEAIGDRDGRRAGSVVRSWRALRGEVVASADELEPGLHRVSVRVDNTTPCDAESRQRVLEQTLCSCHTVLRVRGGSFVSMTDPPDSMRSVIEQCESSGTWPVLVGDDDDRSTVLASPIILPDYPQVAPESPGDLFDATEIDQMLVLNILSLTDDERREMRDSDPRAREVLERTDSLTEEELMRLHGAIRELRIVRSESR
jgi:hypothetical protein